MMRMVAMLLGLKYLNLKNRILVKLLPLLILLLPLGFMALSRFLECKHYLALNQFLECKHYLALNQFPGCR
jgi:hypothetical protein